jgi:Mg-chelatase subunit ChlD
MLVQSRSGEAVREDDGSIAFHDDDYRAIGEAMILHYAKGSTRMLTPKAVLRVAQLLEVPEIAAMNRDAGFADPAGRKPPLGRWPSAARQWLAVRESNPRLLEGLVAAGYKETIKRLARKVGYKPETQAFFEILGWPQRQARGGHRQVGLDGLELRRRERFDGLDELAICERIVAEKLTYKEAIGRLPADVGLTPAIMVALLPTLSDRDLRIMTPTLESLGLLEDATVRARWERAIEEATDQRALNVARNVRNRELRERLEESADLAAQRAASEVIDDANLHVIFLIDKSGSMEYAIESSKAALTKIAAGVPLDRLHIATFDTTGRVLRPKAASRRGFEHMLRGVGAGGGTLHSSALAALAREGVRIPGDATLIVIVVGDEAGEDGQAFASALEDLGYRPAALALIVSVNARFGRGRTVRDASRSLGVPFSEVEVAQFDDPYQVTRVLKTLLDAPVLQGSRSGWLDRVLATPLLEKPL